MANVAAPTGNEFLDKLLEQTPQAASQPRRGQNYNYPQKLFLKPDGTVVSLQGDPQNRAYYQDKGFRMLSEAAGRDGAPSEVDQYLKVEYPRLLKQQREKAALINAIRKTAEHSPDLHLETSFDDYSIEEIREYLADIKARTGHDVVVLLPRRAQAREDARDRALLAGVETTESASIEALQSKLERGQGYDPIDQAQRRSARPSRGGGD